MEHLVEKLRSSRAQLAREGVKFLTETRQLTFSFWNQTVEAGSEATRRAREAGGQLFGAFRAEADAWQAYLRARRELAGDEVRQLMSARVIEERLLSSVRRGLSEMEGQVGERLDKLSEATPARLVKQNGKGTKHDGKRKRLPIADYESLTAKDIVARLDALSPTEVKALYDHERRTKQRRTVLRAAKQRIAA